jgi:hypothetical protein
LVETKEEFVDYDINDNINDNDNYFKTVANVFNLENEYNHQVNELGIYLFIYLSNYLFLFNNYENIINNLMN